ncbi:Gfo/Idh/MocA family protein [Humisphaera borealis]|uniref:Gfo/Idh/MocA family oxidoreductase n=1 Tax=Humisphaera borealis TaxID=2807512 RepID=A0A7M2WXX4_9BACT|nr:Gfo/Idh/MocA family oxidoreductase [Humisphaera borealis]QOV90326.1 Gfo/Idh/MocA family oxidoreductase [Humisphaera borealis]
MPRPLSRRKFLAASAAVTGAATLGFPNILRGQNLNSKMNIAVIACGGRGRASLDGVKGENVVALCDVNDRAVDAAKKEFPEAKTFKDFRKLYDTLKDSEFDAVTVATPEHTHAFATMPALKRKKHVYCEKPLTRDVHEARLITLAAKEAGVTTQMGTQIHAGTNYRRVVELIQAGAIGPVTEAHVWVSRAWGWQSEEDAKTNKDIVWTIDRPKGESPVPPYLDWDLWVGPAPMRPYHDVYFPGPKWYRWWDFGNGTMSDLGSHWNDLPWWALKLDAPTAIEAGGPPPHPEIAPASMYATYEYGQRGDMPPVKLTWYQGAMKPKIWTDGGIPQWANGVLFVGSEGRMLLSDYGKHVLLPEAKFTDFKRPAKTIPDSIGHHAEWIKACKNGKKSTCDFSYSGPLTEANHLGNVAYRAGRRLEWDTKNMKFTNAPEAERFLRREYRKGWEL